ncbi:insulinase family protein [Leeia sp. TBRC 13508]|uniref:Insulinase family protein n=1 Tax=Leeia speluncae TaxID=2884804 RepID=A0ABS8D4V7_9NEIS|nr:M16 family metallopeptidase [Leeia speluncae]MCB6183214.1 insulinase family protein [Leeia speluncae]
MLLKRLVSFLLLGSAFPLIAAPLPPNAEILQGTLPNGVKYLIQPNAQPAKKVELRLIMEAGSTGETDAQKGYAHFVEHMAFQHTKHFQNETVGQFIESLGMRIGPDSNAYTSFNETVYMLPVPTDDEAKLKKATVLLADWVGGITFRAADAQKESRVITEEWRMSEHPRAQIKPADDVLYAGSRYVDRSPIGEMALVRQANIQQLNDFYRREYRPERATVIAVGDINPSQLKQMLEEAFKDIPPSTPPKSPVVPPLTLQKLPATLVMNHDSLQDPLIKWVIPATVQPVNTEESIYSGLAVQMAQSLFARRLDIQSEQPDYPISKSGVMTNEMVDRRDNTAFLFVPRTGKLMPAWQRVQQEVVRASEQGFTEEEYQDVRLNMLNQMRQMAAESHANTSEELASSLLHDVLQRNVSISPAEMLKLTETWFQTNRLAEVNAAFQGMMHTKEKMLTVMLPSSVPLASVKASQFNDSSTLAKLPVWTEKKLGALTDQPVNPGNVLSQAVLGNDIVRYRLSNGAEVYFKQTQNTPGKVVVSTFSSGGLYNAPPNRYTAASMLDDVLNQSGAGDFSLSALSKMTAGKLISSSYWLGAGEQGVSGEARTEDLADLFALMHLQLTKPRIDPLMLSEVKQDTVKAWIQSHKKTETLLIESLANQIWSGDYRKKSATPAQINEVNDGELQQLANQYFTASGPWKMVIVGDVNPSQLTPLLNQWVASLPANQYKMTLASLSPKGAFVDIRNNSAEAQALDAKDRSQTMLFIRMPEAYNQQNRMIAQVLEDVLQQRLEAELRQKSALVYGIGVDAEIRRQEGFRLDIDFSSQSTNASQALDKTKRILEDLQAKGVNEEEFKSAILHSQRVWEDAEKDDHVIAGTLVNYIRSGEPLQSIRDRVKELSQLDRALVNQQAKHWFDKKAMSIGQVNPFSGT